MATLETSSVGSHFEYEKCSRMKSDIQASSIEIIESKQIHLKRELSKLLFA